MVLWYFAGLLRSTRCYAGDAWMGNEAELMARYIDVQIIVTQYNVLKHVPLRYRYKSYSVIDTYNKPQVLY